MCIPNNQVLLPNANDLLGVEPRFHYLQKRVNLFTAIIPTAAHRTKKYFQAVTQMEDIILFFTPFYSIFLVDESTILSADFDVLLSKYIRNRIAFSSQCLVC